MGVKKQLVIWDLDNTLTDTLGFWATATYPAVQALSAGLQIAEDRLISAIQQAPGQFRFCDFGRLLDWLDDNGHLDSPAAMADPVRKQALLTALRQQWYDTQGQMTVFYEGALEAMQTVKASGAAQVIDTDTEASSLIRRYWLLAQSAKASGAIANEKDLLDLVDQFYCQPSFEDDSYVMSSIPPDFIQAIKSKMTIWADGKRKPSPDHARFILADFNTKGPDALYIGDSSKDGGTAVPAGIDFAWFMKGADADNHTVETAQKMASPNYKYGLKSIYEAFNAQSYPSLIFHHIHDIIWMRFKLAAGNGFKPAEDTQKSVSDIHRKAANPAADSPQVLRLGRLFQSPQQLPPQGPPTHLP